MALIGLDLTMSIALTFQHLFQTNWLVLTSHSHAIPHTSDGFRNET